MLKLIMLNKIKQSTEVESHAGAPSDQKDSDQVRYFWRTLVP